MIYGGAGGLRPRSHKGLYFMIYGGAPLQSVFHNDGRCAVPEERARRFPTKLI